MSTYADSTLTGLGMSRNRPPAVTPSLGHHFVLATDLEIGQQIRDRGALHTIDEIHRSDRFNSVTIIMEDGGRLAMPLHQHVTVWAEEAAHA